MTFARLTRGDWVATVAALALLLVMALDWYSTDDGVNARKIEQETKPRGATAGEVARGVKEDARIVAEKAEQTAWQADPTADRVILAALLAAIALALAAAWLRAAGVRMTPPLTPSALAAGVGLLATLLLAARIAQKPGADLGAVVKLGAPLGLVCVGLLTLGARAAWRAERDGSAWGEGPAQPAAAAAAPATGKPASPQRRASQQHAPLFDPGEAPAPAEPEAPVTTIEPPASPEAGASWAPDWSDPAESAGDRGDEPGDGSRGGRRERKGRRGRRRFL